MAKNPNKPKPAAAPETAAAEKNAADARAAASPVANVPLVPKVDRPEGTVIGAQKEMPLSLAEYAKMKGEKTKTMRVPKGFRVRTPDNFIVVFSEGAQEVPESLVEHYYVVAHKVEPYQKG